MTWKCIQKHFAENTISHIMNLFMLFDWSDNRYSLQEILKLQRNSSSESFFTIVLWLSKRRFHFIAKYNTVWNADFALLFDRIA